MVQPAEGFLVLFDRRQLGLLGDASLSMERYLAAPHLLRSPDGELSGVLDRALAGLGQRRTVRVAVSRFTLMPYLLRATPAVANVPATTARLMAAEFKLSAVPLPLADPPRFDASLVWHTRNDADGALNWFREVVITALKELQS